MIRVKHVNTQNQLADTLTEGSFVCDEWNELLQLFNIMDVSLFSRNRSYSRTDDRRAMSKRQMPGKEETSRGGAKSRLERSSTALSLTSRASDSTGRLAPMSSENLMDPTLHRTPSNKPDKLLKIKTIQNVCLKFCAPEDSLAHPRILACGQRCTEARTRFSSNAYLKLWRLDRSSRSSPHCRVNKLTCDPVTFCDSLHASLFTVCGVSVKQVSHSWHIVLDTCAFTTYHCTPSSTCTSTKPHSISTNDFRS